MSDCRRPSEEALRAELRAAAAAHEPDRTAMLNRIAARRASRRRPSGRLLRLAGTGLAVATVLGIGGVARWALADDHGPALSSSPSPSPSVSLSPTVSRSPSPSRSPAPSTSRPRRVDSSPASPPASAVVVRGHPGDTQVEKASVWSDGSINPASTGADGRSDVTIKAGAALTALDLTIRVVRTPGLAGRGATHNVTAGGLTATVQQQGDALLYHFVLKAGGTIPAGTYVFTAHYAYAAGSRNAGEDTYEAFGTDGDRERIHVYGNFSPTG